MRSLPNFPALLALALWGAICLAGSASLAAPTSGEVLVIDDNSKGGSIPVKYDRKGQSILAAGYEADAGKAATDLQNELTGLGFNVVRQAADLTDPASWSTWDLLVFSAGHNISPLASPGLRDALVNYVQGGGHLLIEGGEVAFDHVTDAEFAAKVLHISSWDNDGQGDLEVVAADHALASVPNSLGDQIGLACGGYGDQDGVTPAADAVLVSSWSQDPGPASLVAFDANPDPEGGQVVFFPFNYSTMEFPARTQLLQNAVQWLLTPEGNGSAASGTVTLADQQDPTGVLVQALPNGGSQVVGADGRYRLEGLYAGHYRLIAGRPGWSAEVVDVTLAAGEQLEGVDFRLRPVNTVQVDCWPELGIPDDSPAGITDQCSLTTSGRISNLGLYVDISHSYIGDLVVTLISPAGTRVRLHNRSGGTTNDLHGWYPEQLTPIEPLTVLLGEEIQGVWQLAVADRAPVDVGELHAWSLRLTFAPAPTGVPGDGPSSGLVLGPNFPNPFNPTTRISFSLAQTGRVGLAVHDLAGRRVATLWEGILPAGPHQLTWDGRDGEGRPVGSGVYLYRLVGGGSCLTGRMTLAR